MKTNYSTRAYKRISSRRPQRSFWRTTVMPMLLALWIYASHILSVPVLLLAVLSYGIIIGATIGIVYYFLTIMHYEFTFDFECIPVKAK